MLGLSCGATDRQTGRQTDSQTDRQTDGQTKQTQQNSQAAEEQWPGGRRAQLGVASRRDCDLDSFRGTSSARL